MSDWTEFVCAAVVFLASHALPARPGWRAKLVRTIGRPVYGLTYSLVSFFLLGWLIMAADRAPYVMIWPGSAWGVWAANVLMLLSVWLVISGIAIANPFSLGGVSSKSFDPEQPGVLAVTRHPMLWGLTLWSAAHLIVNGDIAHVLLFGGLGLFAVLGLAMLEGRARRQAGASWSRQTERTSLVPFAALVSGRSKWSGLVSWRICLAIIVWTTIVWLHRPILGVSPLPALLGA